MEPRKTASQPPAAEVLPERPFDEARQAFAVPQARGTGAEGLEVIAHDLIEHDVGGRSRPVLR
jgi:hypothetical protein